MKGALLKGVIVSFRNVFKNTFVGNRTLECDIVWPVNLRKCFFSIGLLDNNDHNPTSVTGLFKKQALVFYSHKKNEGTSRYPSSF